MGQYFAIYSWLSIKPSALSTGHLREIWVGWTLFSWTLAKARCLTHGPPARNTGGRISLFTLCIIINLNSPHFGLLSILVRKIPCDFASPCYTGVIMFHWSNSIIQDYSCVSCSVHWKQVWLLYVRIWNALGEVYSHCQKELHCYMKKTNE